MGLAKGLITKAGKMSAKKVTDVATKKATEAIKNTDQYKDLTSKAADTAKEAVFGDSSKVKDMIGTKAADVTQQFGIDKLASKFGVELDPSKMSDVAGNLMDKYMPQIEMPNLDVPDLELPKDIQIPDGFEMPKFEMPDMKSMF